MKQLLASLALVGILATTALACPPVVRSYCAPSYVAPVIKKAVVVEEVPVIAPLAIFVPVYSAGFVPGVTPLAVQPAAPAAPVGPAPAPITPAAPSAPAPATPATVGRDDQAVLQVLKDISRRLDTLEKQQGAPATPPASGPDPFEPLPLPPVAPPTPPAEKQALLPAPTPALLLAQARCAQCHKRGHEDQGAGFVLLEADGSFARLDLRFRARLARKLQARAMPPRDSGLSALTDGETALLADPTLFSAL